MSTETAEHDAAVLEKRDDTVASLAGIARFAEDERRPGFAERATRAAQHVKSLTESYLAACADNDRLRAMLAAETERAEKAEAEVARLRERNTHAWATADNRDADAAKTEAALTAAQAENERLRWELLATKPLYSRRKLEAEHARLRSASASFLEKYIAGVNSGDWGNWDPEEEPEVIDLRAALARRDGGTADGK